MIGTATVELQGGEERTLRVALNRRGRRLLEQFGRLPATLTLTVSGGSVPSSWPVTFRAAERP